MPPREETPLDQEVFDKTLAAELAKGTDRRVAEGRARAAGVRAYRKVHGEPEREAKAPEAREHAAAATGDGEAAQPAAAAAAARPAAAAAAAPAAAAAAAAGGMVYAAPPPAAPRTAPPPTGRAPSPRPGAPDKHRLLALVPPEGIQRVEREQGDRINVFPHLLIEEFISLLVVLGFLTVFSTLVNAPLRELANPNLTPNPSKAPWYFLGLQELLRYFHPMIAGVIFPTLILVGLAAIPYVDRNPSTRPGDRKLIITLFTMLFMFGATLTIAGSFFRGTGYNWAWPWSQGLFFEL
ncbi:MAG TPA: menaquinol-cytochrome c reductase cytochrome b subunit [Actinomycetota bacterium]|nr:menaquinol-cytochrome c reductase cytochrome b subunit [Actinomycetota bacterium]